MHSSKGYAWMQGSSFTTKLKEKLDEESKIERLHPPVTSARTYESLSLESREKLHKESTKNDLVQKVQLW